MNIQLPVLHVQVGTQVQVFCTFHSSISMRTKILLLQLINIETIT